MSSPSLECTRPVRCALSLVVWRSPARAFAYFVVNRGVFGRSVDLFYLPLSQTEGSLRSERGSWVLDMALPGGNPSGSVGKADVSTSQHYRWKMPWLDIFSPGNPFTSSWSSVAPPAGHHPPSQPQLRPEDPRTRRKASFTAKLESSLYSSTRFAGLRHGQGNARTHIVGKTQPEPL